MIGETVSHYTIIEKVGEGGMGIVYRARDVNLDRIVAIKVLPGHLNSDAQATRRFIHEARAASALDHPNIGTIYEIDTTDDGVTFIAMAYYDGGTLRERIDSGEISAGEARDICSRIAAGLDKAHSSGIVHRDIKPSNILFSSDGEVKIVDFGLAKLEGRSRLTREGTTLGTAAYMSPEQAQGLGTDGRSDIFSLGVILYEMLAGHLPFSGEHEAALLYGIVHADPESLPEAVIEKWEDAVPVTSRALAKDPEFRYRSAGDMRDEITGSPPSATSVPRRSTSRIQILLPVAIIAVSILAVFLVRHFVIREKRQGQPAGETASVPKPPLRNWILIADFEGPEEDPRVAPVVRGRIEASVSRSGFLTPLSRDNMIEGLKKAMIPDTVRVTGDVAWELAYRSGSEAYVEGSVDKIFGGYAVQVSAFETGSRTIMFSLQETSEDDAGMFRALERIGDSLLVRLGANADELARSRMAPDVKSASMEVFMLYEEALELTSRLQYAEALDKLDEALVLDPGFAPGWLQKAALYYNRREFGRLREASDKADSLKDRLTDRQLLTLHIMLANAQNEFQEALELVRERIRKYGNGYNGLAVIYHELGMIEEAYEASRINAETAPFGPTDLQLMNLSDLATLLGKYGEADGYISMLDEGIVRASLRFPWLIAQSRFAEADSINSRWFEQHYGPWVEYEISKGAFVPSHSRPDFVPGSDYELHTFGLVFYRWHLLDLCGIEIDRSYLEEIRDEDSIGYLLLRGYIEASGGRASEAAGYLSRIEDRPSYERNKCEKEIILLRAWIEKARGNAQGAVELLRPNTHGGRLPVMAGNLTFRWLLAETLEGSGQTGPAIEAYESALSPVGLSRRADFDPRPAYVSLSHRRLALLYAEKGDSGKAREHIAAFEAMFTEPSPELMWMLAEVRAAVNGMN